MIATSPARKPLTVKLTSHFLLIDVGDEHRRRPAAQAASVVLAATRPMPSKSMADSVLPGLKPYQPNQSSKPPEAAMVRSCGNIGPPPSRLNLRPRRGSEHDGAGQSDEAADGVHHRRTGEIMEAHPAKRRQEFALAAHRGQEAIRSPGPVADDRIDEARHARRCRAGRPTKPVRPIIAPEVMVEQVSAKANWKSQKARNATPVLS